jgi:hypothetical protein
MHTTTTFFTLALAALAAAKTDLEGCTSSETVAFGGASMIYWVPDSGEICSFLDCGGGRAPPKTTVPGCAQYSGTASYTPDYMPGYGPNGASATPTPSSSPAESSAYLVGSASSGYPVVSSSSATLETITSAPVYSSVGPIVTGTGAAPGGNGTATFTSGTPSSSNPPAGTGAANAVAVGQGVLGLAGVIAGLAML